MKFHQQVKRAIKAMDACRDALEPLSDSELQSHSVTELRTSLRECADYWEAATWWREKKQGVPQ